MKPVLYPERKDTMEKIAQKIYDCGLVPVVKLDRADDAVPLAKALLAGGIGCIEVTFRTAAAEAAIRAIHKEVPQMLLGAGTVLTPEQAQKAVDAGAEFIVSPGLSETTVSYCVSHNIPIFPGCATPSDVEKALSFGLTYLKFFPAEASGGLKMIKAMCGPYTNVVFMPTGGINEDNMNTYLAYDKILACGGSWMVKESLIQAGQFDEITRLADSAMRKMLNFSLAHIGINQESATHAAETANALAALLGASVKEGNSSIFVDTSIEVMKRNYLGQMGHIGFATSSVQRAVAYLKAKGYAFREDTYQYDANGKLKMAYLQNEIGGFAIHFVNR